MKSLPRSPLVAYRWDSAGKVRFRPKEHSPPCHPGPVLAPQGVGGTAWLTRPVVAEFLLCKHLALVRINPASDEMAAAGNLALRRALYHYR